MILVTMESPQLLIDKVNNAPLMPVVLFVDIFVVDAEAHPHGPLTMEISTVAVRQGFFVPVVPVVQLHRCRLWR